MYRLNLESNRRGSFGATEESAATGVRRAKRRDSCTEERCRPALTSPRGLYAHPPEQEGAGSWGSSFGQIPGRGLGLAAWTQPEGVSAPQLARRKSGKKSGAAEQARDFFLPVSWCTRRGDSDRRLNELQRRARAVAISADPRDGHETLRLLLPPPRSLCASTGHSPHHPSWEPVQPATTRVPWCRDNFPGRTHGMPQAGATSCWPLPPQARPASVPLPPPGLSEPEPPNQLLL